MKEGKTDIGVIVGRFQTHELHSEHIKLIQYVLDNHDKVILFIGTTSALGTRKNPMDFITRKCMIEEVFNTRISAILPLQDQKSDIIWSNILDNKVREIFSTGSVTLYGSKDSFIPYYSGKFVTSELEPDIYVSATDIRNKIGKQTLKSSDFRAGIIYSIYSQYPQAFPTVDIVIRKENQILLGRKPNEDKWRFVGGFVDPTDDSFEHAAKREVYEETGLEVSNLTYISSRKVNDWRYSNIKEKGIITTFFEASYMFGVPTPNDDICELKWFNIHDFSENCLVSEHVKLYNDYTNCKLFQ